MALDFHLPSPLITVFPFTKILHDQNGFQLPVCPVTHIPEFGRWFPQKIYNAVKIFKKYSYLAMSM